jgi:uncharacterized membrane protein YbhN (UPF0104 family)
VILPTKTIKDSEDVTYLIQTIKEKGYYWKRRIALGVMIVDFPFLIISLLVLFLFIYQVLSLGFLYLGSIFGTLFSPFLLLPFVPIIIFLVAILFAERIKKEDKYLFEELKQKNYSSWTFQPKDKRKIGFIFLYSFFFLIISWIIVKLLMLSVGGQIINSGNPGIQF